MVRPSVYYRQLLSRTNQLLNSGSHSLLMFANLLFIKKNLDKMFNKYGVEKYDAFDDVGGKLSFALALLDKENTGLILNAVHSRDNCFLYMKEIVKGESYVMLSQEEVEALRKAVNFGLDNIEE